MSIRRSFNFLNQARVDVSHLRSLESAVRNDFDEFINGFAIGPNNSYILRGFEIFVGSSTIGSSANSLQMIVEDSALWHGKSNEAGTTFVIPTGTPNQTLSSTTNVRVNGAFTPNAINYVGIEFKRKVDTTTNAQVFFWNPVTKTEFSKNVPLAEILDYEIVISPSTWSSNVLPIAVVNTNSSNNVSSIEDRRPMFFRLGTGGTNTPDQFNKFSWSEGRSENFWSSSTNGVSPFSGGDKVIRHEKDWKDAIMSMFVDITGGPFWYSQNSAGSLKKIKNDLANLQMTGSGKIIHAKDFAGQINWDSDILLDLVTSRLSYRILTNPTGGDFTLQDNEVGYIKFVRGQQIIPNLIFVNNSNAVESVGAVSWTNNIEVGDYIKVGSDDDTQYYEIATKPNAYQVTLTEVFAGTDTGLGGVQAQYAYGYYEVVSSPSTDRHVQIANRKDVPFDEDIYWLFLRKDNGSPVAKVYIRGSSGGELEQGEEREIADNIPLEVLEYIGSPAESENFPDYLNAVTTGTKEVTELTFPQASVLTSGQAFELNSAVDANQYYVWANIASAGGDPNIPGKIGIEVPLTGTETATQTGDAYFSVLDTYGDFNVTNNNNGTIVVENSQEGFTTDAANIDMPVGFSISITTQGSGTPNYVVSDTENLTKSIKRLDTAVGEIQDSLDVDPYDEAISIVASASLPNELSGPVAANTPITIPVNSRNSGLQESYIVGSADLNIYLNGVLLKSGDDYTEIGGAGDNSVSIEFAFELVIGDIVVFEKPSSKSGSGGGGGSSIGQNLGAVSDADIFKQNVSNVLQFRRLTSGANITITQNADDVVIASTPGVAPSNVTNVNGVNYTLNTNDNVILASNAGNDITLTLPDASSASGIIYQIKKIDAGNNLSIKSVLGQTLDGVDIDMTPYVINIQYESITIVGANGAWFII